MSLQVKCRGYTKLGRVNTVCNGRSSKHKVKRRGMGTPGRPGALPIVIQLLCEDVGVCVGKGVWG